MSEQDKLLNELGKKYNPLHIIDPKTLENMRVSHLPTGSLSLDLELGGGWPKGRIVEVYGPESSGKTMLALKAVAESQKEGKKPVWIDLESSWDSDWASTLGVKLEGLTVIQPDTAEEAADFADALIRIPETGLVVLDAVADMISETDEEKSMSESQNVGSLPRIMTRLVNKLRLGLNTKDEDNLLNENIMLFLNQVRENIGAYIKSYNSPGGHALKHAAAVRLELTGGEWIEGEENGEKIKVGRRVKFVTRKNKTYMPLRKGEVPFYFAGENIGKVDNAESLANYMKLLGIVKQTGSIYTLEEQKYKGIDAVVSYISESNIYKKYDKEVRRIYIK